MTALSDLGLMDRLEQEIRQLMDMNRTLRAENHSLRVESEKLRRESDRQHQTIRELEEKHNQLLLRKSITEVAGGVRSAKLRINRLLKEVDQCIALMNK